MEEFYMYQPSYIKLYENGELHKRRDILYNHIYNCTLCPMKCNANRNVNNGVCGANDKIKISEYVLYPGEEPPITGDTGAGGVFFSNCNMRCVYCQNFLFSQKGNGKERTVDELADIFINIQEVKKAKNLDLITATPYLPFIFDALIIAIEKGFNLPIVWNTSSFENPETLDLLDGVVDIYLPDIRYTSNILGKRYSNVKNYWDYAKKSIKMMYNQIGNIFHTNEEGVLLRGLIIRILVLPNLTNQAKEALKFIKYELSDEIHISLMDQYVPVNEIKKYPKLNRFLYKEEYEEVVQYMGELELNKGWVQHHKLKSFRGEENE
jgi:putative pyruvate formate lyase activating enzyme